MSLIPSIANSVTVSFALMYPYAVSGVYDNECHPLNAFLWVLSFGYHPFGPLNC